MVRPAQPMRRNASKRRGWSSGRNQRREHGGATRRSSGQVPVYATRIRHGVVGGDARDPVGGYGPMSAHPERLGANVNRELRDRLVADGEAALRAPRGVVRFTGDVEADALLNDLAGVPQAFVFACLVDRQITAELAWMVPTLILRRFGSLDMSKLESLTERQWVALMREPTPAHRSPETMALVLFRATRRIVDHYGSDASKIWNGKPASAALVRRFLEFHGAGPKIATMAANILVRDFHIPLADHRYVDISADAPVKRVMARLGFVEDGSSEDVVIYAARELNPEFPGVFDFVLRDIGRTLCRPTSPMCSQCPLSDLCSHARTHG
jgi:endonuclease-3